MTKDRDDLAGFNGTNLDVLPRWLRDLIDYNNESAGLDTGRMKRFFGEDRSGEMNSEKRREKERRFETLMRLLQDPDYARLYKQVWDAVAQAEEAAKQAMQSLALEGEAARKRLEALRQSAAELPDGTKVYQSKIDGHLYTEDGRDVTDQKDSVAGLSETSPDWEKLKERKAAVDDVEIRERGVETYQRTIIDRAKERLTNEGNAPSDDELRDMLKTLRDTPSADMRAKLAPSSPQTASIVNTLNNSAADEILGTAALNAPAVAGAFKTASEEAYASSSATLLPTTAPKPT